MVRRHRKKSRRYLGSRSCGAGNIKHRRGKGSRGGVGYGGTKNKWTYLVKYEPDHFGRHGFVPPRSDRLKEINLWEINKMIEGGKLEKDGSGRFVVELSGYKVLGSGRLSSPVFVKATSFSKSAVDKIKSFGGDAKVE
ncbi:uL15 family ribosomal protein [Candidatus Micrarchaeota archaeon]|nr:uL15 family ribosomal protein [Candidatus Micrarchaeota archaeon]